MTSPTASYIYSRAPGRFGSLGADAIFQATAKAVVDDGVEKIKKFIELQGSEKLHQEFFEILELIGSKRSEAALLSSSLGAENFGKRRDTYEGTVHFGTYATNLTTEPYAEYGARFLESHAPLLSGSVDSLEEDSPSLMKSTKNSVEPEASLVQTRKDYAIFVPAVGEMARPEGCLAWPNRKVGEAFKREHPEEYKKEIRRMVLNNGKDPLPDKIRVITKRINLGPRGGMYAMAQFLIDRECVMVMHQDPFLVETTLQEISHLFQTAILWTSDLGIEKLQDQTALIRYLFALCMPFKRGSAAAGEWLDKIIYAYHDYSSCHSTETSGDLEAIIAIGFESFRLKYRDMVLLNKII